MKSSSHIPEGGAYIVNRMKLADDKRAKLLDILSGMARLSYEKGTRDEDAVIREKVKAVAGEIEEIYRTIRVFSSGKGGDRAAFNDILLYFDEHYVSKFKLSMQLEILKKELEDQEKKAQYPPDREEGKSDSRKVNLYIKDLAIDLQKWEKVLLHHAEPMLRQFLVDVNEIVLYHNINEKIGRLITSDDVFARSGDNYQEFKDSISRFVALHIKLTRLALSDADIIDLVSRMLQLMGFRSVILHSRNINQEKFNEMIGEIIQEGNLREHVKNNAGTSREALDAIRSHEKKLATAPVDARDLIKVLEDLIYVENLKDVILPEFTGPYTGLADKDSMRYLFHAPGTFDVSLKFISEYTRDSLIFVIDWLNKELQKAPSLARPLAPVLERVPDVRRFVSNYKVALDVSANKSNQSGAGSRERHYISKNLAKELIDIVKNNCNKMKQALIESTYNITSGSYDKSGVLVKKISLIKESCNDSYVKINKGLSEIGVA
jgi:hypothetical protein